MAGTGPVFRVMGQLFFGLPNLFFWTHKFFDTSWIYYPDRTDALRLGPDGTPYCTEGIFFWNGQAGGLEGLRQKGWTLLKLLVILRESKVRNTRVTVLAQGDNQVINTHYVLSERLSEIELTVALQQVYKNNSEITSALVRGMQKLGLKLNREETMTSTEYLNYGKVPVIRGKFKDLPFKKVLDFEIYQGATTPIPPEHKDLGIGGGIVMRLADTMPCEDDCVLCFEIFHVGAANRASRGMFGHGTVMTNRIKTSLKSDTELLTEGSESSHERFDLQLGTDRHRKESIAAVSAISLTVAAAFTAMNSEQSPAASARLPVPVPLTLSLSSAPEPSPAALPPAAELHACRQQQFLLNRNISCDAMEPTNARIADQPPNSAIQPT
ncbi:hypothetical protein HPB49_007269 [Dermacentor silvarum]|uniref:Uncharacterized protein n=1 Tax=Dermacentor silvarum TaxID=543639 RepID=A0ACB8CDR1_DERSI|nr:hypothetical protein HPB49_007269 [Dermacentor silvarum]